MMLYVHICVHERGNQRLVPLFLRKCSSCVFEERSLQFITNSFIYHEYHISYIQLAQSPGDPPVFHSSVLRLQGHVTMANFSYVSVGDGTQILELSHQALYGQLSPQAGTAAFVLDILNIGTTGYML